MLGFKRLKLIFPVHDWLQVFLELVNLLIVVVEILIDADYLQEGEILEFPDKGRDVVEFENPSGYQHGEELD